jgi:hypothetical protein
MTVHHLFRDPLKLHSVQALPDYCLHLVFDDEWSAMVHLSNWIHTTKALMPLRNAEVFETVQRDEFGLRVLWQDGEIDLGADNLRNLATEQAGGIGHESMVEWMHTHHLTQQQAADAIGISRRMLNYYLSATKPIPKTVWLACLGWQSLQHQSLQNQSLPNHKVA